MVDEFKIKDKTIEKIDEEMVLDLNLIKYIKNKILIA